MTDASIKIAGVLFVALFVFCYLFNIANKAKQIGKDSRNNTQQAAPSDPVSPSAPSNPPNNAPPSGTRGAPLVQPNPTVGPEWNNPTPEPTPAESNSDPSGLVGRWAGPVQGLTEVWTVRFVGGRWEVSGAYFDGAKEVGSFATSEVKVSGRTISFVHRFVKIPPGVWGNGSAHSATLSGNKLTYTWWFGGSSGSRTLARLER